jgi:hypothetical protein
MRRIGWWSRVVRPLLAVTGVACLAAGPQAVRDKLEGVLFASWEATGEALVDRDLAMMSRWLDDARDLLGRARARRDENSSRLHELESRLATAKAMAGENSQLSSRITSLLDRLPDGEERALLEGEASWRMQRSVDKRREITQLDAAVLMLADEIERADSEIRANEDRLSVHRSELAILVAARDARRLRQELAGLCDAPPRWEARVGQVAELFRSLEPQVTLERGPRTIGHLAAQPQSLGQDGGHPGTGFGD